MKSNVLPAGFRFSQSNLEDYTACRRRFLLRYVKGLDWPAPVTAEAEGWEAALRRGQLFHDLVQQDALGLDVSPTVEGSDDPLLQEWWRNYLAYPPRSPEGRTLSEVELAVPLAARPASPCGDCRLVAKFDRLVFGDDGRVVIVDWKTGRKRPDQDELYHSWQTTVYRYVLVEGGDCLNGGVAIPPETVSLVYWHAGYPDLLAPIGYARAEHEEARRRLQAIVKEILSLTHQDDFNKTEHLELCWRCEYRSLCGRGRVAAEEWEIADEDLDFVLPVYPTDRLPEAEY